VTNEPDEQATQDTEEPTTEDDESTQLTPDAFKGLQRNISKKDQEISDLRRQVQEAQSRGQSQGMSEEQIGGLLRPLLERIQRDDPEEARRVAGELRAQMLAYRNQQLEGQLSRTEQQKQYEEAERRAIDSLRGIASDLGVDPDSTLIDYGNANMWLQDRITLVRESAKQAKAKTETPPKPKPTVSEGTAHNPSPGTPPSTRVATKTTHTQADYQAAARAYAEKPSKAAMAKMLEIKEALKADLEAALVG